MNTPNVPVARRPEPLVGHRVELARYAITGATRVIYGQRIGGVVRVVDLPLGVRGRAYLVERGLEQDGNAALNALVIDYVKNARARDQIPMATTDANGTVLH